MKIIYLMRHGETLFNTMELNQGHCDSPLTEKGIRQAQAAHDWFAARKIGFDTVYSSTSERACDTAEIVSGGMPYTRRKDLKEILLGTMEATPTKYNPPDPYGDYYVPFGGEGLDDVTRRMAGALQDIAEQDNGQTILVVSHGVAIRQFLTTLPSLQGQKPFILGNCGIVELTCQDGNFEVRQIIAPASEV